MAEGTAPLVSVVIPCYNADRWIAETLTSVLRQTWTNLEVIVVNDGSTDGSRDRVLSTTTDLTLIDQPNRGSSAAMNAGIRAARGEFIQFLDADDVLGEQKIERQVSRLLERPGAIAAGEWARFYDSPSDAQFVPEADWFDSPPVDWLLAAWRDGGGMLFPARWLVPHTIVDRAGFWREDLSLNNDGEYFARVVLASEEVLFCPGARAFYRSGVAGSLSGRKTKQAWESQRKSLLLCERHLLSCEDSDRTHRVLSFLWQRFAHAVYPYERELAIEAMNRGRTLHQAEVQADGGALFRAMQGLIGWRAARILQHWYYRTRYDRA